MHKSIVCLDSTIFTLFKTDDLKSISASPAAFKYIEFENKNKINDAIANAFACLIKRSICY